MKDRKNRADGCIRAIPTVIIIAALIYLIITMAGILK